jgi:F0F1-type ATP synthase beta subunit
MLVWSRQLEMSIVDPKHGKFTLCFISLIEKYSKLAENIIRLLGLDMTYPEIQNNLFLSNWLDYTNMSISN